MNTPIRKARAVAIAKAREDMSKIVFRSAMLGMGACVALSVLALLYR
ncbi:hypothetical protein ACQ3G6_00320 [Allorhizobium undicola]|nr:hypothetical protein [Allorhizobium undicola]